MMMKSSDKKMRAVESKFGLSYWIWALVFMWLVFLVINYRLLGGAYSAIMDADQEFVPYYTLIADHIRSGMFLTWNLWTNGGEPTGFDPQSGAFSILHNLIGLIFGGRELGFRIIWLLIWGLGGTGVILFARHMSVPPWGALACSIAFLFSGLFVCQAQHTPLIFSISFLPWIVWRYDVAIKKRSWLATFQCGALLGASGLGGYPVITMLNGVFIAFWGLGTWIESHVKRNNDSAFAEERPVSPALILVSLIVVAAVLLIVFAPGLSGLLYETRGFSDRSEALPREWVLNSNTFIPGALITIFSPVFGMLPFYNPGLWKEMDWSFAIQYTGAIIPVFAAGALIFKPKSIFRWWILGMILLFMAFAMGNTLPFRGWLYDIIPATRYWRNSILFQNYFFFSLLVLALYGIRDLSRNRSGKKIAANVFFLTGLVLSFFAAVSILFVLRDLTPPESKYLFYARIQLLIAWLGLCVLLGFARFRPKLLASVVFPIILVALTVIDMSFTVGQNSVLMMKPSDDWQRIDQRRKSSLDQMSIGYERLMNTKPVYSIDGTPIVTNKNIPEKFPVLKGITALRNRFHDQWAATRILSTTATGGERTWFAAQARIAAPTDATFKAFLDRAKSLGRPPLLVHPRDSMLAFSRKGVAYPADSLQVERISKLPPVTAIAINLKSYGPTGLEFDVDAPEEGWLLVTERWARSWRLWVNGERRELFGGDFIFRAVKVQKGQNRVRFEYHPLGYPWLILVSWAMLLSVAVLSVFFRRRSKIDNG